MFSNPLEKLKRLAMDINLKDTLKAFDFAKGILLGLAIGVWYAASWVSNVNGQLDKIRDQENQLATQTSVNNTMVNARLDRLDEKLYELVQHDK